MKAIIEYNLPDDQFEFDNAVKSNKMWHALTEIKDELRRIWKYEDLKENEFEMVERIREKFFEILQENEINLN
jgi:nitroimidazol reductase NimA-like FMN-containing flavoprotein (pyridoxamine 5'-phosphate oxidase superfamily)